MDGSTPSSGDSKVIVECTDPSNLFDLVQPLLTQRLPLRELNWKAPNRPLRSIHSLEVDLTRAKTKSIGITEDDSQALRRHQIPGLRKTPYVKVYLLRCDDNEAYKTTSRKALRDWVKIVSAGSEEGHDACEWLILHVVLPETAVASQPGPSKRNSDGPADSTDSIAGRSKWPGRSPSTVLEKIKADFNSTSKSSLDRVAQIRVGKDPSKQTPASIGITQSEYDTFWSDLMDKFKTSVLTSFDMRVRQYEEDIRERDSQRNLPGWNFCTFFILKEGLAKGFEDVGLYEDALVGYEELAYGLDVIIREQSEGGNDGHGGILSLCTTELHAKVESLRNESADSSDTKAKSHKRGKSVSFQLSTDDFVLESTAKPYRELILANNISVFDFRVYIFSRQLALLLKAARPPITKSKKESGENFLLLADVCHRATEFIGIGSRTLNEDLRHPYIQQEDAKDLPNIVKTIISNMVQSWVYRVCLQILTQTSSTALALPASGVTGDDNSGVPESPASSDPSQALSPDLNGDPRSRRLSVARSVSSQTTTKPEKVVSAKTGAEELASARAELFLIARRVIQSIAVRRSWKTDWCDLGTLETDMYDTKEMDDVSLDDSKGGQQSQENTDTSSTATAGLEPLQLKMSASDKEQFSMLFEGLTDQAYRHFIGGNKLKSAESMVADIALQRYRAEDFQTAASLFRRLSSFYESGSWSTLSGTLLELYANCLRKMDNSEEYVNLLVRLLSFWARDPRSAKRLVQNKHSMRTHLDDLLKSSQQLGRNIHIPLEDFFSISEIPLQVHHHENSDGFFLHLGIYCTLRQSMEIPNGIQLTLKNTTDIYSVPIILKTSGPVVIQDIPSTIVLESNITVAGTYVLDEVSFRVGHLDFIHTFATPESQATESMESQAIKSVNQPSIVIFPASRSLSARVSARRHIKLGERPLLELDMETGWNNVQDCTVRIKPATAGMRLRTNEAEVLSKDSYNMNIADEEGSHAIHFKQINADSAIKLSIPYSLENAEFVSLDTRLEISYQTEQGTFTLLTNSSFSSTLPISVNVQDLFKSDILLSRFTIGSGTLVPIRLLDCQIDGNADFEATCGMKGPIIMDISPKQAASLLYIFSPKSTDKHNRDRSLLLKAEYTCLDELAIDALETKFRSDLLASEISYLTGLLLPYLIGVFRSQWTANDLEIIAMHRAIELWPYDDFRWENPLGSIDKDSRKKATSWLASWHKANQVLPLPEGILESNLNRRIVIKVDLPTPPVVVTSSLQVLEQTITSLPLGVGQPLAVELNVIFTQTWAKESADNATESPIEISYELITNSETWLVGGRKRGNINCMEGKEERFAIMLIPQRPGHLLLPSVDIKCFRAQDKANEGSSSSSWKKTEVECEVDYRSLGKTVLVIPDLRETTVALDGDGANRNEWLVSSKKRTELD